MTNQKLFVLGLSGAGLALLGIGVSVMTDSSDSGQEAVTTGTTTQVTVPTEAAPEPVEATSHAHQDVRSQAIGRIQQDEVVVDPRFEDADQERAFWRRRLVGERLTLESRLESLKKLTAALEQAPSSELERRRTTLEEKYTDQARRVEEIAQRLKNLDEAG